MKAAITQYYPGDSPLHRADPRAKFVAVTALAVALFTRDSFAALAVYAAAGVAAFALSRVPLRWVWRALKPVLWLVGLTFVAQVLFAPGEPFFTWARSSSRGRACAWPASSACASSCSSSSARC